jgi:hypothetical protein
MSYYSSSCYLNAYRFFVTSRFWCFLLLTLVLIPGCSDSSVSEKINQGSITFDIVYTNNSGRSFPMQLLPKTIEMKFNNNFASYTIEDRVGLFSISNVLDLKHHKSATLIKVFDKKYVYQGGKHESPIFFRNNEPYDVQFQKDTQRVAGVLCQRATITDKETAKSYDILYSSNIRIRDLNTNTPYAKIEGLLMQFGIQMKNLDMKLTAKKINQKNVTDLEFQTPGDYKGISKDQMEEIINTLLP